MQIKLLTFEISIPYASIHMHMQKFLVQFSLDRSYSMTTVLGHTGSIQQLRLKFKFHSA